MHTDQPNSAYLLSISRGSSFVLLLVLPGSTAGGGLGVGGALTALDVGTGASGGRITTCACRDPAGRLGSGV